MKKQKNLRLLAVTLMTMLIVNFTSCTSDDDDNYTPSLSVAKVTQNCLIDLHLHLDGALSISSARQLAALSGVTLPARDDSLKAELSVSSDCKSLVEFLQKFDLPTKLLQDEAAIERCTYNLCTELKDSGCIYAEIRFAPQLSTEKGLTQDQVVQAAIKGLNESGFNGQLILCTMRMYDFVNSAIINNKDANMETVRMAKKYLGQGVCAIDIAGPEAQCPLNNYKDVFDYAKELGIPYTIHAGEALGPESVNLAIEYGAQRIGHGVRSIESDSTLATLAAKKIPLEVCPLSNIHTGIFSSIAKEPIMKLLDKGIVVTINSDDPAVSNTNVRKELQRVAVAFNLTDAQIKQFLLNSVNSAFLDDAAKASLVTKINAAYSAQ